MSAGFSGANTPRRGRKGAAMVETAMVLLVFLSMLLFILDMGRVLLFDQFFAERVRAASRQAIVRNYDPAAIKNLLCYNSTAAPGGDPTRPGLFGLKPSMVDVQRYGTVGHWDDRLRVTVRNYPMTSVLPMFPGHYTLQPVSAVLPVASLGAVN